MTLEFLADLYPIIFDTLDIAGVFIAAVLGGMVAREMRFDLVGFVVVSIISALGGGMLRDVLIGNAPALQAPPVALTNPYYLSCAILGALVAYLLRIRGRWINRVMITADALVIGCWTATGVMKTLNAGYSYIPAIMMGVITAVGGGLIRDTVVGRTPVIFGGNTLYATASLIGTIPAIGLWLLHMPSTAMVVTTLTCGLIATLAKKYEWALPQNRDYSVNDTLVQVTDSVTRRLASLRDKENRLERQKQREEKATRDRHKSAMSLRARAQHTRRGEGKTETSAKVATKKAPSAHNPNPQSASATQKSGVQKQSMKNEVPEWRPPETIMPPKPRGRVKKHRDIAKHQREGANQHRVKPGGLGWLLGAVRKYRKGDPNQVL
ncbi:trimeric intracellular cation channel family protein [Actinotignum urinale]|uniref:Trimeric intracellular cation channel family protein n=1 Tax=Actinotignum urinale TaxID=190146 RepID=A0ABU5G696_9ACTO|nr:trimeric intracellular cation channel family protein [Actinotignum urinale]MDY5132658.1 trimeric intracellular cation channel family protein [Actinotignum urinale]